MQSSAYGTTSLCQRSRSPSPARLQEMRERERLAMDGEMGTHFKILTKYQFIQQTLVVESTIILYKCALSMLCDFYSNS